MNRIAEIEMVLVFHLPSAVLVNLFLILLFNSYIFFYKKRVYTNLNHVNSNKFSRKNIFISIFIHLFHLF